MKYEIDVVTADGTVFSSNLDGLINGDSSLSLVRKAAFEWCDEEQIVPLAIFVNLAGEVR